MSTTSLNIQSVTSTVVYFKMKIGQSITADRTDFGERFNRQARNAATTAPPVPHTAQQQVDKRQILHSAPASVKGHMFVSFFSLRK